MLVTGALMLGVYTIVDVHSAGARRCSPSPCWSAFVWRQARAERPLLRLGILRDRNVAGANLAQMLMVAGMLGVFFLAVLYLQRVLGYDAIRTGAAFLPISLSIGVLSLGFSARLNGRFGPRAVLLFALASIAAGLALLSQVPVDGRYVVDLLPAMLLLGVGGGLAFPALMTLAMSSVRPEDSGLASGLVNTTQQVGGALGLAILASVAESRTGDATPPPRWWTATAPRSPSRPRSWSPRSSSPRSSCAGAGRARGRRRTRRRARLTPRSRAFHLAPAGHEDRACPVHWDGGVPVGGLIGPVRPNQPRPPEGSTPRASPATRRRPKASPRSGMARTRHRSRPSTNRARPTPRFTLRPARSATSVDLHNLWV